MAPHSSPHRRRAWMVFAVPAAFAVACTDQSVSPTTEPHSRAVVSIGSTFIATWLPSPTGNLRLVAANRTDATGRLVEGPARALVSSGDSAAAMDLHASFARQIAARLVRNGEGASFSTSPPAATGASRQGPNKSVRIAGRTLTARTAEGKSVRIVAVPDGGTDGRPSPEVVTYVDGTLAMVTDYDYLQRGGKWKVQRMRNTVLDAHGKVTSVGDIDFSGQLADDNMVGRALGGFANGAYASILPAVARLVLPDELHAENAGREEDTDASKCTSIAVEYSILLAAASAAQTIAEGSIAAADAAMKAGIAADAACAADEAACPAAAAAWATYDAAVTIANGCQAASLAAAALAAKKAVEWDECLRAERNPVGGSKGGSAEDSGGGTYTCYYVEWYDGYGDLIEVDDLGCEYAE